MGASEVTVVGELPVNVGCNPPTYESRPVRRAAFLLMLAVGASTGQLSLASLSHTLGTIFRDGLSLFLAASDPLDGHLE